MCTKSKEFLLSQNPCVIRQHYLISEIYRAAIPTYLLTTTIITTTSVNLPSIGSKWSLRVDLNHFPHLFQNPSLHLLLAPELDSLKQRLAFLFLDFSPFLSTFLGLGFMSRLFEGKPDLERERGKRFAHGRFLSTDGRMNFPLEMRGRI